MASAKAFFNLSRKRDRSLAVKWRFGSAAQAALELKVARQTVYNWINGDFGKSIHNRMLSALRANRRK